MANYKKELSKDQLNVVYNGEGYSLVLSGPGSGKTRTLVYRTAFLIEKGVPASKILLLTFTKKASNEMNSRIFDIVEREQRDIWGGTFHHIGNIILKNYARRIGYAPKFTIIDEEDSRNLISLILKEKKEKGVPKAPVIKKIVSLSVNSKKSLEEITGRHFPYINEDMISIIEEVEKEYQNRKREGNVMDFDDLLFNWDKILSFNDIRKELSSSFSYILIDEYQDTNTIQDMIARKMSSENNNLLAVGDDAQSIYSFRGANIENILNFSKNYSNAKIFRLEENYRSTCEILSVANNVIQNNQNRLEKRLKSTRSGEKPIVYPCSNSFNQAKYIADYIEKEGNYSKTAVLFRAHFHSVEIEMELIKRRIPYLLRGGVRFFEQSHVKDLIAFLKILNNYYDEVSWYRILTRKEGIGDTYARKITKKILGIENIVSLLRERDKIFLLLSSKKAKESLSELFSLLGKALNKETEKAIDIFMQDFYNEYLNLSFDNATERRGDLKKIKEISGRYEGVDDMFAEFALSENYESDLPKKDAVVLSTIHQAKGLEWDNVFIISLKEGDFPHSLSLEEELIEEERRLFYVAVTRAKKRLFLLYPLYNHHKREHSNPSRFLREAENIEINTNNDIEIDFCDDEWETFGS